MKEIFLFYVIKGNVAFHDPWTGELRNQVEANVDRFYPGLLSLVLLFLLRSIYYEHHFPSQNTY